MCVERASEMSARCFTLFFVRSEQQTIAAYVIRTLEAEQKDSANKKESLVLENV